MSNLDMTMTAEQLTLRSTPVGSLLLQMIRSDALVEYPSQSVPTPAPPSPPSTITYYKIRGFYVVGGVYETWVSSNPDSSPPSGHTLTNITQVMLSGT